MGGLFVCFVFCCGELGGQGSGVSVGIVFFMCLGGRASKGFKRVVVSCLFYPIPYLPLVGYKLVGVWANEALCRHDLSKYGIVALFLIGY